MLRALARAGVAVDLRLPTRVKSPPPQLGYSRPDGSGQTLFTSTYFTRAPEGMASAVLVHDTIYEDRPDLIDALGDDPNVLRRKAECIAQAGVIMTPSAASAAAVHEHYPMISAPVVVVAPGVDPAFHPSAHHPADRRAVHLLSQRGVERPFVLHVGGRRAYKDFATVLRAITETPWCAATSKLVVVGSEPGWLSDEHGLIATVPPGRVVLLGRVDRRILAALYRLASAVVCPSLSEGFGFVPVEAAACGTPVVCSDIASHRETVGDIAHFFAPADAQALSAAIEAASRSQPEPRLQAAGRCRQRFEWSRSAAAFKEALTVTLEPSR